MKLVTCQQTHSDNIHIVTPEDVGKEIPDCDGLITNIKDITLQIKTADCVPIILNDPINKVIGVVHAGWRGTKKEIVKKAVNLMISSFKSKQNNLRVKIGPAIDKDNYLIKEDVASQFINLHPDCLEKVDEGHWKFDIVKVNIKQLLDLGLLRKNITNSNISTFNNKKYPSFRRDGSTERFETKVVLK